MNTPLVLVAIISPGEAPLMCAEGAVEITIPLRARPGFVVMDSAVVAVEVPLVNEDSAIWAGGTQYAELVSAITGGNAHVRAPADRWWG